MIIMRKKIFFTFLFLILAHLLYADFSESRTYHASWKSGLFTHVVNGTVTTKVTGSTYGNYFYNGTLDLEISISNTHPIFGVCIKVNNTEYLWDSTVQNTTKTVSISNYSGGDVTIAIFVHRYGRYDRIGTVKVDLESDTSGPILYVENSSQSLSPIGEFDTQSLQDAIVKPLDPHSQPYLDVYLEDSGSGLSIESDMVDGKYKTKRVRFLLDNPDGEQKLELTNINRTFYDNLNNSISLSKSLFVDRIDPTIKYYRFPNINWYNENSIDDMLEFFELYDDSRYDVKLINTSAPINNSNQYVDQNITMFSSSHLPGDFQYILEGIDPLYAALFNYDGSYKFRLEVTDAFNNTSYFYPWIGIDRTNPTLTLTPTISDFDFNSYYNNLTMRIAGRDPASGIQSLSYWFSVPAYKNFDPYETNKANISLSGSGAYTYEFPIPSEYRGTITMHGEITDVVGHTTTVSRQFRIDNVAPTGRLEFISGSSSWESGTWVNYSGDIKLKPVFSDDLTEFAVKVATSEINESTPLLNFNAVLPTSDEVINRTYHYSVTDKAGNELTGSSTLLVDKSPPNLVHSISGVDLLTDGDYYKDNKDIYYLKDTISLKSFFLNDPGVGDNTYNGSTAKLQYDIQKVSDDTVSRDRSDLDSTWTKSGDNYSVKVDSLNTTVTNSKPGDQYNIRIYAHDALGNSREILTIPYTIPANEKNVSEYFSLQQSEVRNTVSLNVLYPNDEIPDDSSSWVYHLSTPDSSDIAFNYPSLSPYTINIPETVNEGEYTITITGKDRLGRDLHPLVSSFSIDRTAPTFESSIDGSDYYQNSVEYTNNTFTVKANLTGDSRSNGDSLTYRLDTGGVEGSTKHGRPIMSNILSTMTLLVRILFTRLPELIRPGIRPLQLIRLLWILLHQSLRAWGVMHSDLIPGRRLLLISLLSHFQIPRLRGPLKRNGRAAVFQKVILSIESIPKIPANMILLLTRFCLIIRSFRLIQMLN